MMKFSRLMTHMLVLLILLMCSPFRRGSALQCPSKPSSWLMLIVVIVVWGSASHSTKGHANASRSSTGVMGILHPFFVSTAAEAVEAAVPSCRLKRLSKVP